jgi:hypothetical protein
MAKFETAFSCGDRGWTFDGAKVVQRTVGQIRVIYTKSDGIGDGRIEGDIRSYSGGDREPENYAAKPETHVEEYMCVETGIGCGQVYTLGQSFFLTREECEVVCAERIAEKAKQDEDARKWREQQARERLESARRELARLEAAATTHGGGASSY